MKEEIFKITLPSGAKLEINPAGFAAAKALYKACAKELTLIKLNSADELGANFFKDVFMTALASDVIEAALWDCMEKVTYNGARVKPEIFEPMAARADYLAVCAEVARVNLVPFTSGLFARFKELYARMQELLASELKTTTS